MNRPYIKVFLYVHVFIRQQTMYDVCVAGSEQKHKYYFKLVQLRRFSYKYPVIYVKGSIFCPGTLCNIKQCVQFDSILIITLNTKETINHFIYLLCPIDQWFTSEQARYLFPGDICPTNETKQKLKDKIVAKIAVIRGAIQL